MSLPTISLAPTLESAVASKHPWLYRNHLPKHTLAGGDWVRVEAGRASDIGLYDAHGAVAVRFFNTQVTPDRDFILDRVKAAVRLRAYIGADTNAYRLIYGEGDGLPGIVADRYGRFVVIKTYASSVKSAVLDHVVWSLGKLLKLKGIMLRTGADLEPLWGELPPPEVTISENGLKFIANLYEGQKTGLFLDQRENRQTVRRFSKDKTVLNLFSYNGGFSVYALAGGASQVSSVDIAEAANRDAQRNAELNGFANHTAITADVFELLKSYAEAGKQFDLVVLDPPSLAKDKSSRRAAERAYRRLNKLALRCVNPGGLLATASCTSQVSETAFRQAVTEAAAEAGVSAQIIHEAGHALDHPVPLSFLEGRYLKFMLLNVAGA